MRTILLLIASNAFMTMAWYGHLNYKQAPLWIAIGVSWLIALPEYILQVPANRIGHSQEGFSAPQLKIIQEVISISVFMIFSYLYLREAPKANEWIAFLLIIGAVIIMMYPRLTAGTGAPLP